MRDDLLPDDYTRCGDAAGCPQMADCRRTEPTNGERAIYALMNSQRQAEGVCRYYLPREA